MRSQNSTLLMILFKFFGINSQHSWDDEAFHPKSHIYIINQSCKCVIIAYLNRKCVFALLTVAVKTG